MQQVHAITFFVQDAKADVILKYSADEARNLKSYGEMLIDIYLCLMLKSRSRVSLGFFLSGVSKVFDSRFHLFFPGEFPESVKINETVDFVGGKPFLAIFNIFITNITYLSQISFYK